MLHLIVLIFFIFSLLTIILASPLTSSRFGPKTRSIDIINEYGSVVKGKTAIVTGGNSGIGLETVRSLASVGVKTKLLCRNKEAGLKSIESFSPNLKDNISVYVCDLEDLKSIKSFVDQLQEQEKKEEEALDILILNAGIMALPNREETCNQWEKQIGVNHFGHVYLYSLLERNLLKSKYIPRVVTLASTAHTFGNININDLHYNNGNNKYSAWGAYGQSKLANILFAKGLSDRMKDKMISLSVHPGVIKTNLWRHSTSKGGVFDWLLEQLIADKDIEQGAATTLWTAISPRCELSDMRGTYCSDCNPKRPSKNARKFSLREELWKTTKIQLEKALRKNDIDIPDSVVFKQ